MRIARQIIRGAGRLPGVGEHPGNFMFAMFLLMGAIMGSKNGLEGVLIGVLLMLVLFGPFYLWGCYARAELSDRMTSRGGV